MDLPPAEVIVEPRDPRALSTGLSSVVAAAPAVGTAATLADVAAATPGVGLRRSGLPGSFATLSLRGLSAQYVAVVLDDLPLTSASLGPVNLDSYPAASLERIEIYRGAGPVRLESPLGGVIRLVSSRPPDHLELSAHAGFGSFTSRTAHLTVAGPQGEQSLRLFVGYEGTAGDFTYYDDRNTLYTSADDATRRRGNDGSDALTVRGAAMRPVALGGEMQASLGGRLQRAGVPGPGAQPTSRASTDEAEVLGRIAFIDLVLAGERARLAIAADGVGSTRRLRDPLREIGLPFAEATTRLLRVGVDGRLEWLWSPTHESEVAPRVTWDAFRYDAGAATPVGTGRTTRSRLQVGVGIEHRADLGPLRVVPSLRFDGVRDSGVGVATAAPATAVSPRLGVLWPAEPCELRANAGRFHRVPTTVERFGDGALVLPGLDLRMERGTSVDGSLVCRGRPFGIETRAEVAVFASRVSGLIVYVQQSQLFPMPVNLGRDDLAGTEAALVVSGTLARGELAYSLTYGRDRSGLRGFDGNVTVGAPLHRLHAALGIGPAAYGLRYEVTYTSTSYLDRANVRPVPPRLTHDAFVHALLGGGFEAKLSVTNLTNRMSDAVFVSPPGREVRASRVDFLGYPLPGRAFLASVLWRN